MRLPERNAFANPIMTLTIAILHEKPLTQAQMEEMREDLYTGLEFYEAWIKGWRGYWHEFKAMPKEWTCPGCQKVYQRPDLGICDRCKAEETSRVTFGED